MVQLNVEGQRMIQVTGLRALSARLARLDMRETQNAALEHAARLLQEAVQERLSHPPGGDHTAPWRRTGSLQNSIELRSDVTSAAIGSDDPVTMEQELGTDNIPPRPFLSTTAAAHAEQIAFGIAGSIVAVLQDATKGTGQ